MIAINAKTFADALALVSGAIERKTTIPILSNVRLSADWRRGTLRLEGTDLETALAVTLPASVTAEIHLTVPARELLAFVKTIDKGVTLKLQKIGPAEAGELELEAAGMSARFCALSVQNWPVVPAAPMPSAMIPGAMLADALRKTTFAVANEESRYTLIGSLLEIKGEALTVTATDGHRLSHYKTHHYKTQGEAIASTADFKGIIPKAALLLAGKILKRSKGVEVQFSTDSKTAEPDKLTPSVGSCAQGFAHFQIGNALLTFRLLSGQFPDYERVMSSYSRNDVTATVDRKQFAAALKQVGKFADERSHAVSFAVNGKFELAASGSDAGSGKVSIPVEHGGADIERVGFNYEYLLDGLAALDDDAVTMHLKDEEHAGVLRASSGLAEWSYVVMPMRV